MLRRIAILTLVVLSASAGSALAATTWHAQVSDGTSTSARTATKCSFQGSGGTLTVTCKSGGRAVLTYTFTADRAVVGTPSSSIDADSTGNAGATSIATGSGKTLKLKVVVTGAGSVSISSVTVGYYTT